MAMGCFMAIGEGGLRIPRDISVVGYDDDELSRHLRPQLTTLELPHRPTGAWAIEHLALKPEARRAGVHKVACTSVSRGSIDREPA
ncbi:substrate-binding domain-containing protein [Shinella curvata]|uniref:Substrate-binding domain-containing protein n=1 Tax=Shinella curvata TaxID=1817964 RepID=A0ABT8XLS4_9HYPH|nr:substrate-binding domain-containing protein [Shinella curvata]MCJ8057048.1 substrate-binding domain-containing protein [Shinella curvata]MDO6124652.1 substrate-binding domain-containing protein [Shinella curvata]